MSTIRRYASSGPTTVGTFHAKTHFSELLARVARGEEIAITKHDRPIARLVPAGRLSREEGAVVFRQLDGLRLSLSRSADQATLKQLVHEGRRF